MRLGFVYKHAVRELKANWKKNIFYTLSIFLGIAALVSVNSFSDNLKISVEMQSKSLKGSDLSFSSSIPFKDSVNVIADSLQLLGMERSNLSQFLSMVLNPKNDNTRLVQAKAISGGFPWYGELITEPNNAWTEFQKGQNVILDDALRYQLNIAVGDSVKLGDVMFKVQGFLKKMPGENSFGFGGGIGSKIYFPAQYLKATNLIQPGSRVTYSYEFKAFPGQDIKTLQDTLKSQIKGRDVRISSYLIREQQLGEAIERVGNFLGLISMISLLLGGVGIASSINVYIRNKIDTISILRCLGATGSEVALSYLIVSLSIGMFGILLGVLTGIGIQFLLPSFLSGFLPVELEVFISFKAVFEGIVTGLIITVLFALFPLLKVLRVSPLNALRRDMSNTIQSGSMIWLFSALGILFVGVIGYMAVIQAGSIPMGIAFTAGIFTALLVLFFIAWLIVRFTKRLRIRSFPYVFRQGISNLHRPNNQTVTLVLALGFGIFLILTVFQVQKSLLDQLNMGEVGNRPNMILFDIQKSQRDKVDTLLRKENLSKATLYPIVPTRITGVNGKNPFAKSDSTRLTPMRREYQLTYKWELSKTEEIAEGKWFDPATGPTGDEASLDIQFAQNLKAKIGDTLNLDILGIRKDVIITSLRKVNWAGMNPNFFVVVKPGLLESAPQTFATAVRIEKPEDRSKFQRKIVGVFPNIMALDLTIIIETVESVLGKINLIIQFMGFFCILTGLIVVIGAIANGRFQRIREAALLRTLGGIKKVIQSIFSVEFVALGTLSALTGAVLAYFSSWLLIEQVFQIDYSFSIIGFFVGVGLTVVVMLLLGWLINGSMFRKKPLEVLREE